MVMKKIHYFCQRSITRLYTNKQIQVTETSLRANSLLVCKDSATHSFTEVNGKQHKIIHCTFSSQKLAQVAMNPSLLLQIF